MIFDDDFLKMTGLEDVDKVPVSDKTDVETASDADDGLKWISSSDNPEPKEKVYGDEIEINIKPGEEKFFSEYGNPDFDYVIESDLVSPVIQATKNAEEAPLVVCVDDDFDTLDLLEVYLQRNYEYKSFSGPREAIFFLNQKVPELIVLDWKIHTIRATTFMEIIRAGAGHENIRFALTGTEEELMDANLDFLPDYVVGKLVKPVALSDLKALLDKAN